MSHLQLGKMFECRYTFLETGFAFFHSEKHNSRCNERTNVRNACSEKNLGKTTAGGGKDAAAERLRRCWTWKKFLASGEERQRAAEGDGGVSGGVGNIAD